MFNDKLKQEYLDIKAPEELLSRIENSQKQQNKRAKIIQLKPLISAAAVFVVFIFSAVLLFNNFGETKIYVSGKHLFDKLILTESYDSPILLARTTAVLEYPIEIKLNGKADISVSKGYLTDDNGNIILSENETKAFDDNILCNWIIDTANEDEIYYLSITKNKAVITFSLVFDKQLNSWTACLTK